MYFPGNRSGGENVFDLTDKAKPNLVYSLAKERERERAEIRGPNVKAALHTNLASLLKREPLCNIPFSVKQTYLNR